ncbi:hypothetical protein RLOC_00004159 [Lonchura striata]|uniref:Uncharacterized protein n=1 Tax=Lonchura striata TaxID=40157 RepID=A0A218UKY4_9PASE|nr:hypothetical protein RLOC_00004159 [Lonchura striata domestica]
MLHGVLWCFLWDRGMKGRGRDNEFKAFTEQQCRLSHNKAVKSDLWNSQ